MDDTDDILDIDSWFDDEIQSSIIFTIISCIIAIIAFLFLLFLWYKHEKLRKILSFYVTSSNTAEAAMYTPSCHWSDISLHLLSAVCLTLLLYVILKLLLWWCRQFGCYHVTLRYHRMRGPSTAIGIELSNLSEIVNVHIAQVKIPITLLSVHDADHHDYHLISGYITFWRFLSRFS